MLQSVKAQRKKVLVTIDEAVCNKTMKEFASVFQIYMRQELPVFLTLSGLYEKIYELQNEETLTFLYRAPKVELQPLNIGMAAIQDNHVSAIRESLNMSSSLFSVYRKRLIKKGILTTSNYGRLEFALPQFKEFVLQTM